MGFSRNAAVCGDLVSVECFSLVFFKYIITNIMLLICKMTTHRKACTLPAVHLSRSKHASRQTWAIPNPESESKDESESGFDSGFGIICSGIGFGVGIV